MRIGDSHGYDRQKKTSFEDIAQREARKAQKQEDRADRRAEREAVRSERRSNREAARNERRAEREADRAERRADREAARAERQAARAERQEHRESMHPVTGPMPVEPDGGIGDGAGPIPFPPEVTTLAIGEEDGGIGGGPIPIGGKPIPVEPDGGIGDGAGPPEATTLAVGEEDGGIGEPEVTTFALGEEDDGGGGPEVTTLALGEEDGGSGFPIYTPIPIDPGTGGGPIPPIGKGPIFGPAEPVNGPSPTGPVTPPSRGGGLLFLYGLGRNSIGATNVTLNTDGTGIITGPSVNLPLSGGGFNANGDWAATAGSGTIDGKAVTLKQNADGNVFVAAGEGGLADRVEAWISDGRELVAEVVSVAQP